MNSPIVYHGDLSNTMSGPHLVQDGKRVSIEQAFKEGVFIRAEDMPCVMTLITRELQTREENAK